MEEEAIPKQCQLVQHLPLQQVQEEAFVADSVADSETVEEVFEVGSVAVTVVALEVGGAVLVSKVAVVVMAVEDMLEELLRLVLRLAQVVTVAALVVGTEVHP